MEIEEITTLEELRNSAIQDLEYILSLLKDNTIPAELYSARLSLLSASIIGLGEKIERIEKQIRK